MISLKDKSTAKEIVLKPDAHLSFETNNPCFDEGYMQGEYVLPFDLPYKSNAPFFNFIHYAYITARQRIWQGLRFLFGGLELADATLDINSVTDDIVNASLRINFSSMRCINTKLREFDYGNDVDLSPDIIASVIANTALDYPATKFQFPPIYNPAFYGEGDDCVNTDYQGVVNDVDAGYASWTYFDNLSTNRNTLSPQVYLHHILISGFAYDGYTVDTSVGFMANPYHKKILVYNNRAIDKLENVSPQGMKASATNSPIWRLSDGEKTVLWNNDSTGGNYDALSAYNPVTGKYTIQATGTHVIVVKVSAAILKNTNPASADNIKVKLYLDTTLLHEEDLDFYGVSNPVINISKTISAAAGHVGKPLYVTIQYANSLSATPYLKLLGNSFFSVNDLPAGTKNVFNPVFNMRDHMPDITFGKLLNEIKKAFCLAYKFDHVNRTVKILYFDDLLKQKPKIIDDKTIYGHEVKFDKSTIYRSLNYSFNDNDDYNSNAAKDYEEGKSVGDGFTVVGLPAVSTGHFAYIPYLHQIWARVKVGGTDDWVYFSEAYYDVITNPEGSIDNRAECAPLLTKYTTLFRGAINNVIIYPCISHKGSSTEFGLGYNPCGLRLMMWAGVTDHFSSQTMPMATCTNIAKDGTVLGIGLHWRKEHNMTFWKKFIDITNNGETLIKKISVDMPMFITMQPTDLFYWDGIPYLPKKISVPMDTRIGISEFEVYKAVLPISDGG